MLAYAKVDGTLMQHISQSQAKVGAQLSAHNGSQGVNSVLAAKACLSLNSSSHLAYRNCSGQPLSFSSSELQQARFRFKLRLQTH
eukprot:1396-Heterococcus_DN1.PRE.4